MVEECVRASEQGLLALPAAAPPLCEQAGSRGFEGEVWRLGRPGKKGEEEWTGDLERKRKSKTRTSFCRGEHLVTGETLGLALTSHHSGSSLETGRCVTIMAIGRRDLETITNEQKKLICSTCLLT